MTVDKNKEIQSISYNHLNLPVEVVKNSRDKLNYTYSASGQKLSQEVSYSNGDQKKTTDYAGPHYYENKNLLFVTTNEGRVVMKPSPEYQYFLKDHLGNIRIVLTSKTETEETRATLESDKTNTEGSNFINYRQAVKINTTLFDHTNQGPTYYSSRLSGTTREKYGLAKSLSVMPGDKVSAEVFAKYLDTNQGNRTAALGYFLAAIVAGTAPTGTIVDGGSTGLRSQEPPRLGVLAKYNNTTAPQAYLTWLIFDRNYSYITGGFRQISTTAREYGQNCAHERLTSGEINITQPGYVYFYLSNENSTPVEVYFDDFKVSHTKSPIVQSNEYYPFGMTFNSYSRENSTTQRFKFQGQENIDDLKLNWDAFQWRNYSSEIGRFFNVDPLASTFPYISPYVAFNSNPLRFIDPTGAAPDDWVMGAGGNIYWDKNANSQETTKQGETYLGRNLSFTFNSYIDGKLWDGPVGSAPVGDKLTSIVTLTGEENGTGELTGISATTSVKIGETPIGKARSYFPELGGNQNKFSTSQSHNQDGTLSGFRLNFEQHASVSRFEAFGLHAFGYDIVNVAQNLQLSYSNNGRLSTTAATDIFPSALLTVNDYQLFKYNQPSFQATHGYNYKYSDNGMGGISVEAVSQRPAPSFYQRYKK